MGYPDFHFFSELEQHGGLYIVRWAKSLNPMIIQARNGQGRHLPKLEGKKLQEITHGTNRSQVLDLKIRRGKQEFRIVRRWFTEEKWFCIWILTFLPTPIVLMTSWRSTFVMAGGVTFQGVKISH